MYSKDPSTSYQSPLGNDIESSKIVHVLAIICNNGQYLKSVSLRNSTNGWADPWHFLFRLVSGPMQANDCQMGKVSELSCVKAATELLDVDHRSSPSTY
jgi:hypothetical protein